MGNMPYCRFQNTLQYLQDCYNNFDDTLGEMEHKARLELLELCQEIVNNFDKNSIEDLVEKDSEEF